MTQPTTIALYTYGGGMRGLIPAHIMTVIEYVTGLRMAEMVDIFAGASTGSILNAGLVRPAKDGSGKPQYRARHLVRFYEREGINIFPPDRFRSLRGIVHDFNNRTLRLRQLRSILSHGHYDPAHLNRMLRLLYGNTKLSDTVRSLIVPVYNIDADGVRPASEKDDTADTPARTVNNFLDTGGHAVWLKNIKTDVPPGIGDGTPDVLLHDAVMGSTAAPTFFPCHKFTATWPDERGTKNYTAVDGDLFDNPCVSYHGAIRRHVPPGHRFIMILLGTGYMNYSVSGEDWNRYGSLGVVDPANNFPLINIFFHAPESALVDSFREEMGENLYLFNKPMDRKYSPAAQMDDARPENLKAMRDFAMEMIEENRAQFDDLCHLLVSNRDRQTKENRKAKLFGFSRGWRKENK